ncbi:MAG: hypothetical protein H6742_14900 [Alphaproteobacteria bacterium]|nr:hypothetical protein [Alphaproteobacteria bacterium]
MLAFLLLGACYPVPDGKPDGDSGDVSTDDGGVDGGTDSGKEPVQYLRFFREGNAAIVPGESWTGTERLWWYTDDRTVDCGWSVTVAAIGPVDHCPQCDWAFDVVMSAPVQDADVGCDQTGASADAFEGRHYGYGFEPDGSLPPLDYTVDVLHVSLDPDNPDAQWNPVGELWGGGPYEYYWRRVDTPL